MSDEQLTPVEAFEQIKIRYDGYDASDHAIEIGALAESLKGLGRIIGVAATFAATEKLVLHADARPIKVVVGRPESNCLTLTAAMQWVDQHAFIAGTASTLTASLVTYIVTYFSGRKEEMKHLAASLEAAIRELGHRDDKVVAALIDTVNRMAEGLRPAVKQAVKPVGTTAQTMTISGTKGRDPLVVDRAMREAIDAEEPVEVGDEIAIVVRFVEMNWDSRTCRIVTTGEDEHRYTAEITDPEIQIPNNAYATAFAAQTSLTVRAKPTLRSGEIDRWFISGHVPGSA